MIFINNNNSKEVEELCKNSCDLKVQYYSIYGLLIAAAFLGFYQWCNKYLDHLLIGSNMSGKITQLQVKGLHSKSCIVE